MFIPSHPVLKANFLKYLDLIWFVTINYDYRNHISLLQHSMPVLLKIFSGLYVLLCDHIFLIKHYSKKNKTQQLAEPHRAASRCAAAEAGAQGVLQERGRELLMNHSKALLPLPKDPFPSAPQLAVPFTEPHSRHRCSSGFLGTVLLQFGLNLPVLQLRLQKEKAQPLILHCKGPSRGN